MNLLHNAITCTCGSCPVHGAPNFSQQTNLPLQQSLLTNMIGLPQNPEFNSAYLALRQAACAQSPTIASQ